ncbi:MAG: diacylglycerol O-acyltransferase / wax synthase, partial [Solirubrobacteraceae bacterium]|nr:diacylglycerol O-acyltransferase / wax synthase [Solirubrobacteraceae bacterium]
MPDRLSPLDRSFLQVETGCAHMHVAGRLRFIPTADAPAITLDRVRALVAARLHLSARFRQRLALPPGGLRGMGGGCWVDDDAFDLRAHVTALSGDEEPISRERFAALADEALSQPLDRRRPLWRIYLAPWLQDGSVGLILKIHHAMVDGASALGLGLLLLDTDPHAAPAAPVSWEPDPVPGSVRLAADALADYGSESLRAVRGAARALGSGRRIADTVRRTALAMEEDVLRAAPSSYMNCALGARRRLNGHRADIGELLELRAARGTTLNDVGLAVVTGALRSLAHERGTVPSPLKAMVPVDRRAEGE